MKLLLDENLSRSMVGELQSVYPGTVHVSLLGFQGKTDEFLWHYAAANGYCIVSKDNDFRQRSFLEGAPPKVIWLCVGNSGTRPIREMLMGSRELLEKFAQDEEAALLVLSLG